MRLTLLSVIIIIIGNSISTFAQKSDRDLALAEAQKGNFIEAEKLLKAYLDKNPDDWNSRGYLGMMQSQQKKYQEAITTLQTVLTYRVDPPFATEVKYALARNFALSNDKVNTLRYLEECARNGGQYLRLVNDKIFDFVRNEPGFKKTTEEFERNSTPCMSNENAKKLNFLIGIWDVYTGPNYAYKTAVDSVFQTKGGCSLIEHFTYLSTGYIGRGMNFFDFASQKYHHVWTGSSGDVLIYQETSSSPNSLQLSAIGTKPGSLQLVNKRMTWTYNAEAGTIHQKIEVSYDMGRTWSIDFDAIFKKVKG